MVEIGQAIARAREEKGLRLEEIAEQTRITIKYLQDLEQGKFDFLPRPYVLAYLKTVARIVGLDGEALAKTWRERESAIAAAELEAAGGVHVPVTVTRQNSEPPSPPPMPVEPVVRRQTAFSEPKQPPPAGIPYVKEIALGLALLGAMALLLYFSTTSSKRADSPPPEPVQETPFQQVAEEAASKPDSTSLSAIVPSEPVKKPMRLEVRATDVVWVQVVTDKRDSIDYTMRAGNVQAWQALEQFYVRVGNAAAVKLLLDGNDLGVIGNPGQVGGILITHEGIKARRLRGAVRQAPVEEQSAPADSAANNQN